MRNGEKMNGFQFCLYLLFASFAFVASTATVQAEDYTPEHPDVKMMIAKGVEFLKGGVADSSRKGTGYTLLTAYAIMKATEDHDHPKVLAAIEPSLSLLRKLKSGDNASHSVDLMYEVSVSIMFFTALDPVKYKAEIEGYRDFLLKHQRANGSFGYIDGPYKEAGDTSQSQYASLAMWSIKQANIDIEPTAVERLMTYIAKVQRPTGGWSYQNGSSFATTEETHQMLAAGLSAILISGDVLGIMRGPGAKLTDMAEEEDDEGIPQAFRRIYDDEKKNFQSKTLNKAFLKKVSTSAQRWLDTNPYKRKPGTDHFYYWLYSRERYESFLEILNGRRVKNPAWYSEGVETLRSLQSTTGGWAVNPDFDADGPEASTCFAILFLLRNTQKAIGEIKEARNIGGFGLQNVADVAMLDGKVVDKSQVTSIEDALKLLEDSKEGSTENKLLADRIVLDPNPKVRKEQLNRFARLLRSKDGVSRRIAAKLLGRGDDLDFVPDLIYALSDPDKYVPGIAENSLRILSRQMNTYIIPKEGPVTADVLVKAEGRWRQWYLSVRPDHIFVTNSN